MNDFKKYSEKVRTELVIELFRVTQTYRKL